jgi:hypothetical protein
MRSYLIASSLALFAACASQPAAAPPAPAVLAGTAPATSHKTITVQEAEAAGYKLVNESGEQMYCHEQLKTGSHVRKETICLTAEELEEAVAASKRNLEQMKKAQPPPQGK